MNWTNKLLTVDTIIDSLLGLLLGIFPGWLAGFLGLPDFTSDFYIRILGGVLFGIGIASLIERVRGSAGLGLPGAIAINLSGAFTLAGWLITNTSAPILRGRIILWAFVLILIVLSTVEWIAVTRPSKSESL